jgi:hypothetical protein
MNLNELIEEFNKLQNEFNQYKLTTNELIEYNSKSLPQDITKNLKILRNDIEDLRDYIDRLDDVYNKTTKQDITKLKNKVKLIEDFYVKHIAKNLELENEVINIKITLHNMDQNLNTLKPVKNKKLRADINNTKYSIKKLLAKQNEGHITEKELERLKDKQQLLAQLLNM